jgi:SAM-dependent methyltransferase
VPHEWPVDEADFSAYYSFAPAALALRETIRLKAVRDLDLAEPILDVGCGDGLFARLAYPEKQIWGIDINPSEIKRAQGTDTYKTLICGNVCSVDLPRAFFGSAIANCSLEHVPDLGGALANIRTSLKPGARFALIVPTPDWTETLAVPQILTRMGLGRLARAYGEALDRVFHHVHLHDDAWWADRLRQAGFACDDTRLIMRRPASWAFDLLLPPSAVGWLVKRITGRWVIAPSLRPITADLARRVISLVAEHVRDDPPGTAGEYLILAHVR